MADAKDTDKLASLWHGSRARWDSTNLGGLAVALDLKLTQLAAQFDAAQISGILGWLETLNEEDPVCALAVVSRLDALLSRLGAEGLGRWILTGLRMYPAEQARQRAYFELQDPCAIQFLHGEASAADLAAALPSLALLMHGLSGIALVLQPRQLAALHGLALRPVLTPSHLLLPDDYTVLDGPDRYRLYRAAVAHAVAHLRYSTPGLPVARLKPMSIAMVSAIEDARVERLLVRDYPGVKGWFLEFLRRGVKPQELDTSGNKTVDFSLDFSTLLRRMNLALMDTHYQDDNYWVNKGRRLFEAQAADLHDYAAFRRLASILANDLGQMRVPFGATQYLVPEAYRDDNSFLWDFSSANTPPPEPVHLQVKVPPPQQAQPESAQPIDQIVERTDEAAEKATELSRQIYPEWDYRLSLMRTDWCTVVEKLPAWQGRCAMPGHDKADVANIPMLQLRHLSRLQRLNRSRRIRRQWEGDEVDLNAAIEVMIDQRLELSPDPRFFMRTGMTERVSSILVLLDLSESTNDCVGTRLESILDIEKKAALLLVQSVLRSGGRIAVHGFSSNTRAEVNYYRLLEFGAPLDANTTRMICSVPGRYATRMGAALRHATTLLELELEHTDHRAILLVTDGAPSDVDVYQPQYLIEDARAAVHEGRRVGVQIMCVALDPQADPYVRKIFGWNNYCIVDDPNALPSHLAALYARLAVP